MLTPSPDIITLLAIFAPGLTAPTFQNALVLIYGTILACGPRTVTAALRGMGLSETANFGKYHRFFSRAKWSAWGMSRRLLSALMAAFVPDKVEIVLLIDETLERRRGPKVAYKGAFRDAVRSTAKQVVISLGIRWCCVCLLATVPWSTRKWALPFLVVPVLSEKTCQRLGKPHKSGVEWAVGLIETVREWLPDREIVLVGDGGYAAVALVRACQRLNVKFVSRLRIDANLYDFPAPPPKSKRGPKPKKGERQPCFADRLTDPTTEWETVTVVWYGGEEKTVDVATGVALWHQTKTDPVALRWVLVRYEETNGRTRKTTVHVTALLGSETTATAAEIIERFVSRWNIEVTFEEIRAHLGFETQRHWSRRAVGRTSPCLFGLFSLVALMAKTLHPETLPVQQSRWYRKEEATFSDALAAVRLHLWNARNYANSSETDEMCLIPRPLWTHLQRIVCYAA